MLPEAATSEKTELALSRETVAGIVSVGAGCLATIVIVSACLMTALTAFLISESVTFGKASSGEAYRLPSTTVLWLAGVAYAAASWLGLTAAASTAIVRRCHANVTGIDRATPRARAVVRGGLIATAVQFFGLVVGALVYFRAPPDASQFGPPSEIVLAGVTFVAVTSIALFIASTSVIRVVPIRKTT